MKHSLLLLGTEQAISTADTLNALFTIGFAAFLGPVAIGGLFFILKKNSSRNKEK